MRGAVAQQYAIALGTRRLRAALAKDFTITPQEGARLLGGGPSGATVGRTLRGTVRFARESGRGFEEEDIDMLERDELGALVRLVLTRDRDGGGELLKPHNMAQVSPSAFWSLIKLYVRA